MPDGTKTQYYVRHVNVTNAAAVGQLTLRVKRDDGIAVYLNGTEVLRDNLPAGTLTADTERELRGHRHGRRRRGRRSRSRAVRSSPATT